MSGAPAKAVQVGGDCGVGQAGRGGQDRRGRERGAVQDGVEGGGGGGEVDVDLAQTQSGGRRHSRGGHSMRESI